MVKKLIYPLTLLFLSGCWVNDLIIKNLDTIIELRVADTLGLYHAQKEKLEKDTSKVLNEFKVNVPVFQKRLGAYKKMIETGDFSKEKVLAEMRFWQKFHKATMTRMIDEHMNYLTNLSEKQREEFFDEMDSKDEKLEEKIKERKVEDLADGYELTLGKLNKKQIQVLKDNQEFFRQRSLAHLKRRNDFQSEMKRLYGEKAELKSFQKMALEQLESRYSDEVSQKHAEILNQMLLAMDSKGKKAAIKNLDRFHDWLKTYKKTEY